MSNANCFRCGRPAVHYVLIFLRSTPYVGRCDRCVPRDIVEFLDWLDAAGIR